MPDGTTTTLECPHDKGTILVAVDRNGVTVDACPQCPSGHGSGSG